MAQKIDQGAMAQTAHDKNVEVRKDGGPGSGPKQGSSLEASKAQGERLKKIFGQLKPGGGLLVRNTTGLGVKKKN